MSFYKIPLLAGIPHRLDAPGLILLVDDIGTAASIDVSLLKNGTPQYMPNRKPGFRYGGAFDGVILTSAIDADVSIFISSTDVQMVPDDVRIRSNAGDPVFVSFSQQIVPLGSVTVNNTNAQAVPVRPQTLATLVDYPAKVVNTGEAVSLVSDAALRRLVVTNASVSAWVAIGGAGVTMANAAIVLMPGDIWTEDDAAGAAWYAISDENAAEVRIMGVKA